MEETNVDENNTSIVKDRVADHGFAAVPIHFNIKEGNQPKRLALVIPGVEQPLMFLEVSGSTPEELSIVEVDGHVESVSQGSIDAEDESVQEDTESEDIIEEPEDTEDTDVEVDGDDEDTNLSYPHEDEVGNPVAGFLIAGEDASPPVVVVKPQDGETAEDAMTRVSNDHPDHFPGDLAAATDKLGHSPLSSKD